jgi:hypothetical protein
MAQAPYFEAASGPKNRAALKRSGFRPDDGFGFNQRKRVVAGFY